MPRPPRLHVPGGFYRVILGGNHRQDLFGHASDRRVLSDIVGEALDRCNARLHAFCWMSNHLHALVQIGSRTLKVTAASGGFFDATLTKRRGIKSNGAREPPRKGSAQNTWRVASERRVKTEWTSNRSAIVGDAQAIHAYVARADQQRVLAAS